MIRRHCLLSTKPIKNVQQASHYFLGQDNYYTEDNTLAQERSHWWGKGAETMGLLGHVNPQQFTELLKGHLPNGGQLGKKVDGELIHRPGFDLTFSVPKSVSILALLGNDERIFKAIEAATDKTLALIEREQAKTRVKRDGVIMAERTGQLVVAKFLHDLSRDGDPQLHTHCVVMNVTYRKDGKWRSLASKLGSYKESVANEPQGFFESVRRYQKYYGALFRAELAYELRELGYTVEKSGAYGFFEIAGVSQENIQLFSQRRQSIENYLESKGLSGAKSSELATLKTRRAKEHLEPTELKSIWEARAALKGLFPAQEAQRVIDQAMQRTPDFNKETVSAITPEQTELAKSAVREAIAHLSETQVALRENEIMTRALYYSIGDTPVTAICEALKTAKNMGELIPISQSNPSEHRFTTLALLNAEKELLKAVSQSHVSQRPLVESNLLATFLHEHPDLTREQHSALSFLFSSDKIMTALVGPTGSGKTHLLSSMMTLGKIGSYAPIILTPRQSEAIDIKKQLKQTPKNLREWIHKLFDNKQLETVSGFLKRQASHTVLDNCLQRKPLLLVENANQLSVHQSNQLVAQTQKLNGRIIFIGDPQSTLTWQAGTPLTQLLSHGIVTAQLTGNQRKIPEQLKSTITDSLKKNIAAAFAKMDNRILSVEEPAARWEAMAAHYTGLTESERSSAVVLAPTQAVAGLLNLSIRESLQNKGFIHQDQISVKVLLPHYLRPAEQQNAGHYQAGQWIRFNHDYCYARVKRGEYRRIQTIDKKNNDLILEDSSGRLRRWNPQKITEGAIEIFDEKTRHWAVGESLICYRGDKKHHLMKGDRATIVSVTEKHLSLKTESGKRLSVLSLSDMSSRHFDYGYALTPSQAANKHSDLVLAYQNSGSPQSHQRAFYKILSSAGEQAWIYTENKSQLLKTLQKHSGDKLTAIDTILQEKIGQNTNEHIQLLEAAVEHALCKNQPNVYSPAMIAKEAVQYALAYLSEKEAAFAHKEVMTVALTHVLGKVNLQALQQAVLEAEKNGELIRGVYSHQGTRWTTREALSLERQTVTLAQADRGSLPKLVSAEITEAYLQKNQMSTEHARIFRELSAQTDRVVLLQGFAGTGKTTLLQHVEILQSIQKGLQSGQQALFCLAPTHPAAKEIRSRGLSGQTLDRFLLNFQAGKISPEDYGHKIFVVDEASMVSNQKLHDFLIAIKQLGARALLVGDIHQYMAIDAGKPFAILQRIGLSTLYLTHITRQKDAVLKEAVQSLYQKDFPQVFRTLEKNIIEVGSYWVGEQKADDRAARLEKIAADYLDRDPDRRAQTLIITFGNQDRVLQNALIREGLQQRGELTGEAITTAILVPRTLGEVERSQVMHYRSGDILRFNVGDPGMDIKKGSYWRVDQVMLEHQWLRLTPMEQNNDQPEFILWKPKLWNSRQRAGVEVYQSEKRELMAGDLIRWTRTDEALGLLSPELARVEKVGGDKISVRSLKPTDQGLTPEDKVIELPVHHPRLQHWDHAYAVTAYSAQGKTIFEIIINAESWRPQLTSQPSLLVALTRAVNKLTLYTDDKAALLNAIIHNPGYKSSALEIMGEASPDRAALSLTPSKETNKLELNSKGHKFSGVYSSNLRDKPPEKVIAPRLDAHRISHWLTDQAESVLERLLGEPKAKSNGQYRYGAHQGSLIVTLTGDKRGLWHDFQTGQGGHLLGLIAQQKNLDIQREFQRVLREALNLLGASPADLSVQEPFSVPTKTAKMPTPAALAPTPEQQRSLRYARQLARESQPASGTLAERYLREHRGIHLDHLPESIRFHPGIYSRKNEAVYPALLVVAKDSADRVQAVQAIFLDPETAQKADVPVKKQTWGRPSQGCVTLADPKFQKEGMTYLAEGAETALSIYQALGGADVRITLGKSNFKNIDPANTHQQVVLCLDNDSKNNQTDQLIHLAVEKLQEQGKSVMIAQPKTTGWDFNDVLFREGLLAVKTELQQAIPYDEYRGQGNVQIILKTDRHLEFGTNTSEGESTNTNKNSFPVKETVKIGKSFDLEI
jgi:conjugative transfer relaxase protein TraI